MGNVSITDAELVSCVGRPTRYRGSELLLDPDLISVISVMVRCSPTEPEYDLLMTYGSLEHIGQAVRYLRTRDPHPAPPSIN